jgi:DNA-binding MarR family transcriptional regulator
VSGSTAATVNSVDALDAAESLHTASALLSRALGRVLADIDLTWPQAMSLLLLHGHDGPVNATWLVSRLGLGRTAMTAVVDRLERHGWVQRRPDNRDRRAAVLQLTDEGRRVADHAAHIIDAAACRLAPLAHPPDGFDPVTTHMIARAG